MTFPNGTEKETPPGVDQETINEKAGANLVKLNIYFGSKSVLTVEEIASYPSVICFIRKFETHLGNYIFSSWAQNSSVHLEEQFHYFWELHF